MKGFEDLKTDTTSLRPYERLRRRRLAAPDTSGKRTLAGFEEVKGRPRGFERIKGKIPGFGPQFPPTTVGESVQMVKEAGGLFGKGIKVGVEPLYKAIPVIDAVLGELVTMAPLQPGEKPRTRGFARQMGKLARAAQEGWEGKRPSFPRQVIAALEGREKPQKEAPPGMKPLEFMTPEEARAREWYYGKPEQKREFGEAATLEAPKSGEEYAGEGFPAEQILDIVGSPGVWITARPYGAMLAAGVKGIILTPEAISTITRAANTKIVRSGVRIPLGRVGKGEVKTIIEALQGVGTEGEPSLTLKNLTPRQKLVVDAFNELTPVGKGKILKAPPGGEIIREVSFEVPKRKSLFGIKLSHSGNLSPEEVGALQGLSGEKFEVEGLGKFNKAYREYLNTGEAPSAELKSAFSKITKNREMMTSAKGVKKQRLLEEGGKIVAREEKFKAGLKMKAEPRKTIEEFLDLDRTLNVGAQDLGSLGSLNNLKDPTLLSKAIKLYGIENRGLLTKPLAEMTGEEMKKVAYSVGSAYRLRHLAAVKKAFGGDAVHVSHAGETADEVLVISHLSPDEIKARFAKAELDIPPMDIPSKEGTYTARLGRTAYEAVEGKGFKSGKLAVDNVIGMEKRRVQRTPGAEVAAGAKVEAPPKPARVPDEQILADEIRAMIAEGRTGISYDTLYKRAVDKGLLITGYQNNYFPKAVNEALKIAGVQGTTNTGGPGGIPEISVGAPVEAPPVPEAPKVEPPEPAGEWPAEIPVVEKKRGFERVETPRTVLKRYRPDTQEQILDRAQDIEAEWVGKRPEEVFSVKTLRNSLGAIKTGVDRYGKVPEEFQELARRYPGLVSRNSGTSYDEWFLNLRDELGVQGIEDPGQLLNFLDQQKGLRREEKPSFLGQAIKEYEGWKAEHPWEPWNPNPPTPEWLADKGVEYSTQMSIFEAEKNPVVEAMNWAKAFVETLGSDTYLARAKEGDQRAINLLIQESMPEINRVLLHYGAVIKSHGVKLEAAWMQQGMSYSMQAIWRAIYQFDPTLGQDWKKYRLSAIFNGVKRAIIENRKGVPMTQPSEEIAPELEEIANPSSRGIEANIAYLDILEAVRNGMKTRMERDVVNLLAQEYTPREISKVLHVSKARISQLIHEQIIPRARVALLDIQTRLPGISEPGVPYTPGTIQRAVAKAGGKLPEPKKRGMERKAPEVPETAAPGEAPFPAPAELPAGQPAFIAEGKPVFLPKVIASTDDVLAVLKPLKDLQKEHVVVLVRLKDGTVITTEPVMYIGTSSGAHVYAPELLRDVLRDLEPKDLWLIHNHPSEIVEPSTYDLTLEAEIKKILGVFPQMKLVDSIIIGKEGWFSMQSGNAQSWIGEPFPVDISGQRVTFSTKDVANYFRSNYSGGNEEYYLATMDGRNVLRKVTSYSKMPTIQDIYHYMSRIGENTLVVGHRGSEGFSNEVLTDNISQFKAIQGTLGALGRMMPDKILFDSKRHFSISDLAYDLKTTGWVKEKRPGYGPDPGENPLDDALESFKRVMVLNAEDQLLSSEMENLLRSRRGKQLISPVIPDEMEIAVPIHLFSPRTVINPVWRQMHEAVAARAEWVKELNGEWGPIFKRFRRYGTVDQALSYILDGEAIPPDLAGELTDFDRETIQIVTRKWRILAEKIAEAEGLDPAYRKPFYFTHIIEKYWREGNRYAGVDFLNRPTESTIPDEVYMPYHKARRGDPGFVRSAKLMFEVRLGAAGKKIFLEPAIKKAKLIAGRYPPNKQEYTALWIDALLGRPTKTDKLTAPWARNFNIATMGVRGKLGIAPVSEVAPATQLAHNITRVFLNMYLGFAVDSAVQNLTQTLHTAYRVGFIPTAKAFVRGPTGAGKEIIEKTGVSREFTHVMERELGLSSDLIQKIIDACEDVSMTPFQFAETVNKGVTAIAAYDVAMKILGKHYDLSDPAILSVAERVATETATRVTYDTQLEYGVMGRSPYLRDPVFIAGMQFLSFPMKMIESWVNYTNIWEILNQNQKALEYKGLYQTLPGIEVLDEESVRWYKQGPKGERVYKEPKMGGGSWKEGVNARYFIMASLTVGASTILAKEFGIDMWNLISPLKIFPAWKNFKEGATPTTQLGVRLGTLVASAFQYVSAKGKGDQAGMDRVEKQVQGTASEVRRMLTPRYPAKVARVVSRQMRGGFERTKKGQVVKYPLGPDIKHLFRLGYPQPETLGVRRMRGFERKTNTR